MFSDTTYELSNLIVLIRRGEVALPDIQRPFVWSSAKVRDLLDSMYKGFPVGYLLFWVTGAEAGARQIGIDQKEAAPRLMIVDGQQRLTSLFSVMTGTPIVTKTYTESPIRIAFRPDDGKFEVADAATERDPEFIPDISVVFQKGFLSMTQNFLERLEAHRGYELDTDERDRLHEALDNVKDIRDYPFKVVELDAKVSEEHVADVFVRINSEGIQLKQADFILTLMSVFWEKGRKELEEFSKECLQPSTDAVSPYNPFIQPSPDQMLRVSIGVGFRRGRLQHVYSILRGKDLETGQTTPERRAEQFELLRSAQEKALDLQNWHDYLKCLTAAGFRSSRMISSPNTVIFTYIIWLIGLTDFGVPRSELRQVFARFFFMAQTSGRYTNSPETQIESDLARFRDLDPGDADSFCEVLNKIVRDTMTTDYWDITLVNRLDTSSAHSPALSAYWAALNLLDADLLFSTLKVSSVLDPVVTPPRNIERHHLHPKAHLAAKEITDTKQTNAIANMAFIDWTDNAEISDSPPTEYWPVMSQRVKSDRFETQVHHHALPRGWEQMDYNEFLEERRRLIAKIVKEGFETLWETNEPEGETPVEEIISAGESNVLEFKSSARWNQHTGERDGRLEHVIVKTIAGFMNSEGGTLLIGVNDEGEILGIDKDLSTLGKKPNKDGFELFITQLVDTNLDGPSVTLVKCSFPMVSGTEICRVDVSAAANPVFAKPPNGGKQTEFWVRDRKSVV